LRSGERGAESLEFVALVPLLAFVLLLAWQGFVLLNQQSEAENDARALARAAAICSLNGPMPSLGSIDAASMGGSAQVDSSAATVRVRVSLAPHSLLTGVDLRSVGIPSPAATVTMWREPC